MGFKQEFKQDVHENYEDYFAVDTLRDKGYSRHKCEECGTFFWSSSSRDICGDPECVGRFNFLARPISQADMSYTECWNAFESFFESRMYTSIPRYPVVARWRDDTDFVQASIYNFQPYVVTGDVNPPANPLVVPQFCLRFNDIDNVGVTMSHNTGFVMVGQHAFMEETDWDQSRFFEDLFDFFINILKIPKDELILHEDAWVGGGNYGPCMEFFSGGLELANQVYMMFGEDGELDMKVLDMGLGLERIAWFVRGEGTLYEASFPETVDYVLESEGVTYDKEFLNKYVPYGSQLNIDEVDDMDEAWDRVSKEMNGGKKGLKTILSPLKDVFALVEHARTLLIALHDGALPSNVKGGYNLRVLLRRCIDIIDDNDFDITLLDVMKRHAEELEPLYSGLAENLDDIEEILNVEIEKYRRNKEKNEERIDKLLDEGDVDEKTLIHMYKTHGVDPSRVEEKAEKRDITVDVPEDFDQKVSEEDTFSKETDKNYVSESLPETEPLYFDHYDYVDFKARVLKVIEKEDTDIVVLDRSAFYPTGGGQMHDTGVIGDDEVYRVEKQGNTTLHYVNDVSVEEGDDVSCRVDFERRKQLSQHHTATHIITGVCHDLFGDHVWQAGAKKSVEKARIDITHYDSLTREDEEQIEKKANKIVKENRTVYKGFMSRDKAEAEYGTRIYQGGAVPGNELRIVRIEGLDVEACGGTHVDVTGDVEKVKIKKTSKVQDGVVRIEFYAGEKALEVERKEREELEKIADELDCDVEEIPGRCEELFKRWKDARKDRLDGFMMTSSESYSGNILKESAERLQTQPKHVLKTVRRFKSDIEEYLVLDTLGCRVVQLPYAVEKIKEMKDDEELEDMDLPDEKTYDGSPYTKAAEILDVDEEDLFDTIKKILQEFDD